MDGDFTAKDFRTWGATLSAIRLLARRPWKRRPGERALARAQKAVEIEVAAQLGNTPAVCRKAYIDPRVYAAWRDGWLQRAALRARGPRQWETLAVRLLHRHPPAAPTSA